MNMTAILIMTGIRLHPALHPAHFMAKPAGSAANRVSSVGNDFE